MLRHRTGYLMLAGCAAILVVLLALDDPTVQQAASTEPVIVLFPELSSSAQIYGIEVQDVATGQDILLMRDDQGWWYAPGLSADPDDDIPAESIDQSLVENAAYHIGLMATNQWYDATTDNAAVYGFEPSPAYRIRFVAHDTAGVSFAPVVLAVGDMNPDHVAYYVWPETDQRIYLMSGYLVNSLLQLNTESIQVTPEGSPSATESVP